MTRFQKQILMKEEERQQEEAQQNTDTSGGNPSGALNAKHPNVGGERKSETVRYKNDNEFETENQVEVIE